MIETKLFEIRDHGTFIPAVGIACECSTIQDEREQWVDASGRIRRALDLAHAIGWRRES